MIRRLIFFLLVVIGLGAIAGGITLVAGPNGEIIKMDPAILSGSVFENFLIPGIVLLTIIGIDSLLAAGREGRKSDTAAAMMTTSADRAASFNARAISSARSTRMTQAFAGSGSVAGPLTTVTRWPRARDAVASTAPMYPVE